MTQINDDLFLEFVDVIAKRATCDRGRSGCVIVKDRRILTTGFVGVLAGFPSCDEVGHLLEKVQHADGTITEHCHRTIHAESAAILQAARCGVSLEGSTLYCTMTPCLRCAMQIVQAGIVRVVSKKKYKQSEMSENVFSMSNVEFEVKHNEIITYE